MPQPKCSRSQPFTCSAAQRWSPTAAEKQFVGRNDILLSAWQASSPHHVPGRDNKVGREETLGMVAAVEAWVKRDHAAEWQTWLGWLDTISKRVMTIDGVKTAVLEP